MQSSDVFLMVVLPGISLSLQELSFAAMSGNELWANIEQMDKAYRFYKLIDRVFLCDSVVKQESWLSLSDVIQGDMALQTYTSITYNDQYRLAIPSMPLRDTACMWTDINGRLFSTNIARIPVERCYMEYPVTIKPQYEHKKIAAIKELLLVKNLTVQKTAKDTIIHVQQAIVGFVCVIL